MVRPAATTLRALRITYVSCDVCGGSIRQLAAGSPRDHDEIMTQRAHPISAEGVFVARCWLHRRSLSRARSRSSQGGDTLSCQRRQVVDVVGIILVRERWWSNADGEHDRAVGSDGVGAAVRGPFRSPSAFRSCRRCGCRSGSSSCVGRSRHRRPIRRRGRRRTGRRGARSRDARIGAATTWPPHAPGPRTVGGGDPCRSPPRQRRRRPGRT